MDSLYCNGYTVVALKYVYSLSDILAPLEEQVIRVSTQIAAYGALDELILIGISFGGLVGLLSLPRIQCDHVRMVTIGSPLGPVPGRWWERWIASKITRPVLFDEVSTVTHKLPFRFVRKGLFISDVRDPIVPVESADPLSIRMGHDNPALVAWNSFCINKGKHRIHDEPEVVNRITTFCFGDSDKSV